MHLKKKLKLQWMCSESHCCRRGCVHDPIVVMGVFNVPLIQWVCWGSNCCSGCVQYPIVRVGVFRIPLLGSALFPNTCQQSVPASEEIVQLEGGSCWQCTVSLCHGQQVKSSKSFIVSGQKLLSHLLRLRSLLLYQSHYAFIILTHSERQCMCC